MGRCLCVVGLLIGVITLLPPVTCDKVELDRLARALVELLEKEVVTDQHPEEDGLKEKYQIKKTLESLESLDDDLDKYQEKEQLDTDGNHDEENHGKGDWNKIAMLEDPSRVDVITLWVKHINKALRMWNEREAEAEWNYETNVTKFNADKKTEVSLQAAEWNLLIEKHAKKYYDEVKDDKTGAYSEKLVRTLKLASISARSKDATKRKSVEEVENKLDMIYGTATVTDGSGKVYHMEPDLEEVMAQSRDYKKLLWAWKSWREVTGKQMKPLFTKMATLLNESAVENGFSDYGNYLRIANFEQDDIEQEADRLILEMLPLYKQIHAYVRRKIMAKYPEANIKSDGPIPGHLLGNMWAQQWDNILDIVTPYPQSRTAAVTQDMVDQGYDAHRMFKTAEEFYTSIGLDAMTEEFWKNSMIVQPTDGRVVQCHGSASEMHDEKHQDFRIKMCTHVTQEDLQTIHHEMGHIEYYQQYKDQPEIFHSGANSAFHEAVGDTIALSVMTPDHLKVIGLLKESKVTQQEQFRRDINFLMQMALAKVMFLPYAYILDKWRWEVYRGHITPEEYNARWWYYRHKYQGLVPPVERTEEGLDPGAKYHVAANVPYIRYFFSFLGQFQFHKALCEAKGVTKDFHHCDIYKSKEAGKKLKKMLSLGQSRPWPEAMKLLTGKSKFDSTAIKEYFKPLQDWLELQNKDEHIGWK